jgi:hypothetical protein
MASMKYWGIALVFVGVLSMPSISEAQYASQCVDNSQCPAGTLCMNGGCAAQGYGQQPYVVQPGYPQPYYAPQPQQPAQPRTVERTNWGLLIAGIAMLAASYAANVLISMFAGLELFGSSDASLWDGFRYSSLIPIVGPWIQIGVKPTSFDNDNWGIWLIIDGILQAGGLSMLIIGLITPQRETVYSDRESGFELAVLPQIGPGFTGLSLAGRF